MCGLAERHPLVVIVMNFENIVADISQFRETVRDLTVEDVEFFQVLLEAMKASEIDSTYGTYRLLAGMSCFCGTDSGANFSLEIGKRADL